MFAKGFFFVYDDSFTQQTNDAMFYQSSYANLDPSLYHKQPATPLDNPTLVHFNHALHDIINPDGEKLDWQAIIAGDNQAFGQHFDPLAMVYAGHQFGQWAGQLGDGRGLLLAQVLDKHGQLTDLHLKGAGLTPFSRMGDGRAMTDSTIREYLCGHALTHLGIKSSQALGMVISDTVIYRHTAHQAAALLRVSDCHVRLGSLEWVAAYASHLLPEFVHYMIDTYYAHLTGLPDAIEQFTTEVCKRTGAMIAHWQLAGFVHGVMNTDNLNITGSTLDFGPFGMMEQFDPTWACNHSDTYGRYSYQNQPTIGAWNLQMWLMNFDTLMNRNHMVNALKAYESTLMNVYEQGLCDKLGLARCDEHLHLAYQWLDLMRVCQLDYTNSFRSLIALHASDQHEQRLLDVMNDQIATHAQTDAWQTWQHAYLQATDSDSLPKLRKHNPAYVLRNAMAQKVINATHQNDHSELERVFTLLSNPYQVQDIACDDDHHCTPITQMPAVSCTS